MDIQNKEFKTYALNSRGVNKVLEVRQIFDKALTQLTVLCANNLTFAGDREFQAVRESLEVASMFAVKSISVRAENQIQDEGGKL
jgi:DNA-binding PadR family transcriptional regulator